MQIQYQNLLTSAEVAHILRYHPESIRRAIREGRIRAVLTGRTWRIAAEEVERIIRQGMPMDGASKQWRGE